jgi:hypothetical protein
VSIAPPTVLRRAALALVCSVVVAACAREKAPAAGAAAPDSAPHDSAAAPAAAPVPDPVGLVPLPEDKAAADLKDYRISLAGLQTWGRAQSAINAATKGHPEILEAMKKTPPRTLDEMIALMNSQPAIRGALQRSGISAHDYVLTMLAMNQAIEGYQRKASGQTLPPNLPPAVTANIALVEKNLPEIQKILTSITK